MGKNTSIDVSVTDTDDDGRLDRVEMTVTIDIEYDSDGRGHFSRMLGMHGDTPFLLTGKLNKGGAKQNARTAAMALEGVILEAMTTVYPKKKMKTTTGPTRTKK